MITAAALHRGAQAGANRPCIECKSPRSADQPRDARKRDETPLRITNPIFNGVKAGKQAQRKIRRAGRDPDPSIADVHRLARRTARASKQKRHGLTRRFFTLQRWNFEQAALEALNRLEPP
jgi:hypothetical protein